MACGPAAAVNGFVYLQNTYPTIYGGIGGSTYADEVATAESLAPSMMTNPEGTPLNTFISVKEDYLNGSIIAPHYTTSVETGNTPQFVASELEAKEAVEVFVTITPFCFNPTSGCAPFNHFATVTGISWNGTTGKIYLIDPIGGKDIVRDIAVVNGLMAFPTATGGVAVIDNVIGESPSHTDTPEPGYFMCLCGGICLVTVLRRRKILGAHKID